jgi:hypothetical protein
MKIFLSVLMLFIGAIHLCAQNQIDLQVSDLQDGMLENSGYTKDARISGTPYLSESQAEGVFYLKNHSVIKKLTRLNCYYGDFEYVVNNRIRLVNPTGIDSVKIDSAVYVFRKFSLDGESLLKAVKIIGREGDNRLYEYKGVEFKAEVKPGGYIEPKPARFEWMDTLYLFEIKDELVVLRNFKNITLLYPKKETEIKKYIKDNHININKPDKLKRLLNYISSLR